MEIPDEITQFIDWLEALPTLGKIGFCVGTSLIFLAIIKYFLFKKLSDFDLSDERVQSKMQQRYGTNIPLEEPVVAPADLFDSQLLMEVN